MSSEVVDFPEEEGAHARDDSHATVGFYSLVAVILCVITGFEVGILYPPLSYMFDPIRVALLIFLSVVKFATVVAFFMHLYFDHPLCAALFIGALILAAGTMVGLIHVLPAGENPVKYHDGTYEKFLKTVKPEAMVMPASSEVFQWSRDIQS